MADGLAGAQVHHAQERSPASHLTGCASMRAPSRYDLDAGQDAAHQVDRLADTPLELILDLDLA
jgi:hypothetical protein